MVGWCIVVIAGAGLFILMKTTKTGLVPQEDMGTIFVDVRTSPERIWSKLRL